VRDIRARLAALGTTLVLAALLAAGTASGAHSTTAPTLIQNMVVSLTGRGVTVSPNLIVRGTVMRIQVYNHTKHIREVTVGGRTVNVKAKGHQVFILQFLYRGTYNVVVGGKPSLKTNMQVD
jgi:hypothetical protein